MANNMQWDVDPSLPDETNDCADLMLLVFSFPPSYRTEVRRTLAGWDSQEVEAVSVWCGRRNAHALDNGRAVGEEPLHLFDLRQRCAALLGKPAPQRYASERGLSSPR